MGIINRRERDDVIYNRIVCQVQLGGAMKSNKTHKNHMTITITVQYTHTHTHPFTIVLMSHAYIHKIANVHSVIIMTQ